MKKYIYGICFLFTVLVTGQELKTKRIKEKVVIAKSTKKEYSVLKKNKSIKHGAYKEFYKKNVVVSGNYEQGLKIGEWIYKDPKGDYLQKGEFVKGKKRGKWVTKLEGKIIEEEYFNKNSTLDSLVVYDLDGKIIEYKNKEKGFIKRGGFKVEYSTIEDKLDGISVLTYKGKSLEERVYKKGKLMSVSDFRSPNGQILHKSNFENGKGELKEYYLCSNCSENFKIKETSLFESGVKNGLSSSYNKKGKLITEGTYLNGYPFGKWKCWSKKKEDYQAKNYKKKKNKEFLFSTIGYDFKNIKNNKYKNTSPSLIEDYDYKLTNKELLEIKTKSILSMTVLKLIEGFELYDKMDKRVPGKHRINIAFKVNTLGEVVVQKVSGKHVSKEIENYVRIKFDKFPTMIPSFYFNRTVNLKFYQPIIFRIK